SCKSEEGLGDFTFLYTDWFYCVHLLNIKVVSVDTSPLMLALELYSSRQDKSTWRLEVAAT
ncbi:hypothetical protein MEO41_28350, partial [Dolichospermum sp. ST_sed4]|nr:hypothetical protein [Dolichospermum sp. ST_sed4]